MVERNKAICKADELLPARALYGMGISSMMYRDWLTAQTYFLQSINTAQRLQKFDPIDYHSSYIDLGLAYWLSKRYDDALKILRKGQLVDTPDSSRDHRRYL